MAEKQDQEFDTYVKLGRRGLIERVPGTMRELVQLKGTGWVRKGSPNEPSDAAVKRVEEAAEEAAKEVRVSPTAAAQSAALADEASDVSESAPNTGSRSRTAAAAKDASTKAEAKADAS